MIETSSNLRAECRVGVMSIVRVYNYTFQDRIISNSEKQVDYYALGKLRIPSPCD